MTIRLGITESSGKQLSVDDTPAVVFNAVFLDKSGIAVIISIPVTHINIIICNGTADPSSAHGHIRQMLKIQGLGIRQEQAGNEEKKCCFFQCGWGLLN